VRRAWPRSRPAPATSRRRNACASLPELRSTILVGLAEASIGRAAPENTLRGDDAKARSHIEFFYRGSVFGKNLLTLAYDSQRSLNRTLGRDRLFQADPLERVYPIFGDSSTRFDEVESNSKIYARVDRNRSYAMFGDFEPGMSDTQLAGYARKLTGAKVHLENSNGDFLTVTGARPDTAFARDVFPASRLGLINLSYPDVLPGSETVALEVRDRRNPERLISREPLLRSLDYNFDPLTGQLFFLRPISAFDYNLNLVQLVVTYEHRAADSLPASTRDAPRSVSTARGCASAFPTSGNGRMSSAHTRSADWTANRHCRIAARSNSSGRRVAAIWRRAAISSTPPSAMRAATLTASN
jgi:hypothetical protein